jgi:hypothetical protein
MKDENNVIETKTEKENKMSDTNVEVEKESNAVLSKLSEEQFNQLRFELLVSGLTGHELYSFNEFYPTLNTELLTLIKKVVNPRPFHELLTTDEFISILKDYGSVRHYVAVDGEVTSNNIYFDKEYDISATRIEEIGVDEIKKWEEGSLKELQENITSHTGCLSSLEVDVLEEHGGDLLDYAYLWGVGVSITTKVIIMSLPEREELFPEKLVA